MQNLRPDCCKCERISCSILSPDFSSRVEALQRHIALVEQLIAERIRKEELEAILPSIQKMLTDEISATENRILEAWKEHWAIWGLGEGPEMPNVYLEEQLAEEVVERSPGRQQAITQVPIVNQGQSLCEESKTVRILNGGVFWCVLLNVPTILKVNGL